MPHQIAEKVKMFYDMAREIWPIVLDDWQLPKSHLINLGEELAAFSVFEDNVLLFNPLFYYPFKDDFLFETVGHEVAHLIAFRIYGEKAAVRPHGKEWRNVMVVLGVPPKIFQTYTKKQNFKNQRFICACSGVGCGICKKDVASF